MTAFISSLALAKEQGSVYSRGPRFTTEFPSLALHTKY
jgi:hypothetical protein